MRLGEQNCPINDIQILKPADSQGSFYADYQRVNFADGFEILFSKMADSRPVVRTVTNDFTPCMNEFFISSSVNRNDPY